MEYTFALPGTVVTRLCSGPTTPNFRVIEFIPPLKSRRVVTVSGLVVFSLLAGCVSSPESQQDQIGIEVPARWANAAAGSAFEPQSWMADFSDPKLEAILAEALEHNFSLLAAAARRDADLAGTRLGQAEIWPTLGLSASKNESRRNAAQGIQQTPTARTFGLNGRFNWEIDLWGKLRNGYRGDLADAEAALADFEATRLSIAGRTAQAWYQALEAQAVLELSERTLEAFLANQRTVEEGFERGIGGALEVRLIRANVAGARSSYEAALRQRQDALRAMELLLGRYPAAELELTHTWPDLDSTVPAGLPVDLLLRRPDVVAAERDLAAAQQRKYEARKAMLPNFEVTLTRGTNSTDIGDLLDLDSRRVWSRVWSVSQPLFQGGRLRAGAARTEALERQAVANYTNVVLQAFSEVEDTLEEQGSFERELAAARISAEESIAAGDLAWERYESGLADITTALDADRRSINAQRTLIQVTNRRIQSRINLYLALGGGFTVENAEAR